jgi:hypothetical protein
VDRRTRNLFALVLVAVIGITGVAAILGATGAADNATPSGATPIVGVIVGVQSQGLDKVTGFTLRTTDRGSLVFTIGQLENGTQFPPGHLVEHQATAQPVRVWYRTEGDVLVAIRLEDAP